VRQKKQKRGILRIRREGKWGNREQRSENKRLWIASKKKKRKNHQLGGLG